MSRWTMIAMMFVLAGCAAVQKAPEGDAASGHWTGEIERDGWSRPVSFDLARDGNAWHGQWKSLQEGPGEELENVAVRGSEVRFETEKLRVVGRVTGSRLRGTVTDKDGQESPAEIAVTNQPTFTPSSEWAPPTLP